MSVALGLLLIAAGAIYDGLVSRASDQAAFLGPDGDWGPLPAWVDTFGWMGYFIPLGVLALFVAPLIRRWPLARPDAVPQPERKTAFWAVVVTGIAAVTAVIVWPDQLGPGGFSVGLTIASCVPLFTFTQRSARVAWLFMIVPVGLLGILAGIGVNADDMGSLMAAPFALGCWLIQAMCFIIGSTRGALAD